jgi:hypothetical protein
MSLLNRVGTTAYNAVFKRNSVRVRARGGRWWEKAATHAASRGLT